MSNYMGLICCLMLFEPLGGELASGQQVRIKDITTVEGVRVNQLSGLGLVTGLDGTGGTGPITRQFMLNFLSRRGIRSDPLERLAIATDTQQKTGNMAVVVVRADLPAFVRRGATIPVTVSAIDAQSLQGGELQLTPLLGLDDNVYAMASGAISLGGFSAEGDGASVKSNHRTKGHITTGTTVEREVEFTPGHGGTVRLLLRHADFATADRIRAAINAVHPGAARAIDAGTVDVIIPFLRRRDPVGFVSEVQLLKIQPDSMAQVVIDENSGTIVFGANVKISEVAINHGNLTVQIAESPVISQPAPFSQGVTAEAPRTALDVIQDQKPIAILESNTTVGDLAKTLNALGVAPRDLSSILRMLHLKGAIHAEVAFK